jgi:hypothetical protein
MMVSSLLKQEEPASALQDYADQAEASTATGLGISATNAFKSA